MSSSPGRRVPKQARARAKVDKILTAAREVLLAGGPEGFNTNLIAKRAGVGIGSLYEYFPNKQAIVHRMIEDLSAAETDEVMTQLARVEDAPIAELVGAVVKLVASLYQGNHQLYRGLWALSATPRSIGVRPAEQAILAKTQQLLEPHAHELAIDNVELVSFTVFHLIESLSEQMAGAAASRFGPAGPAEIVKVVLRYLGVPTAAATAI